MKFETALKHLREGRRISRKNWYNTFIFMQVPAEIDISVVTNMQSLPKDVKEEFAKRYVDFVKSPNIELKQVRESAKTIKYKNQIAIVYPNNTICGWSPLPSDLLEEDWIVHK